MVTKLIKKLFITLLLAGQMAFVGAAERVTYYHNDALGSPVAATDAAGNVLWREAYRPYGSRLLKQDGGTNDIWFTGKQEDSATGLSYFGARWYDPNIGRFMAIDPVGFSEGTIHSFNRYAYANNNPYKYVDPDGEFAVTAAIIAVAVAFTVVPLLDGFFSPAPSDPDAIQPLVTTPTIPALSTIRAAKGVKDVAKKPVVIGENMKDRVIPAAKKRGADYYKPRKTKGDPLKKNERWIDDKMREGREIIDIGPDPKRSKRSPFYEAEKRKIEKRNYPVTK